MSIKQAKDLRPGDQVTWNDPDEGRCSKTLTIEQIVVRSDGICMIGDTTGAYLECFAHELS